MRLGRWYIPSPTTPTQTTTTPPSPKTTSNQPPTPSPNQHSFPLPASNASSGADDAGDGPPEVLLRYGYRNNVCPSRTTPYAPGIDQASCGLYGKSHVGFVPILPVVKRVALLPFDPTVAATNVEEARAEAEVLKEA